MNKETKQVVQFCRTVMKQVRHDTYFSATLRANFVVELEKFDSKKGYYLIVVRDRRVPKGEALCNHDRLRADWVQPRTIHFHGAIWEMANNVVNEMQAYERNSSTN